MDPISAQSVLATAGAAAGDKTYVDDVFSTYLLEGNGSTQTVVNGIDLSGEGGLVWSKGRDATDQNALFDTERGTNTTLVSNSSGAETTYNNRLTAYNSNGFTVGGSGLTNENNKSYVSWTFRKAPGFFDVVTYTGTSGNQTISHNLGSVPGMIIVKELDQGMEWCVYHRSLGNGKRLQLQATGAAETNSIYWPSAPTSTTFTVGSDGSNGFNGWNYVAYIFAHDDQSFGTGGDEAIIKCGTYTGTGTSSNPEIDLGFEPQWLMLKNTTNSSNWVIVDIMRGFRGFAAEGDARSLVANQNGAEPTNGGRVYVTSQGFTFNSESNSGYNSSGSNYIYMAIRRPNKPPTAGTEVFKAVETTSQSFSVGFPADLHISAETNSSGAKYHVSRLTNAYQATNATSQESAGSTYFKFDLQDSFSTGSFWGSSQHINWQFRRAPGFMDAVTYTGTGSAHTQTHNLEVAPELYIMKGRNYSGNWVVITTALGSSTQYAYLNSTDAFGSTSWTLPTSTGFYISNSVEVNNSGSRYQALLFASLDGISKVGTYSGTGYAVNVDCGFTAGARFVMIKRTDSTGNWYVWDTTRGIVSGNDPYLLFDRSDAQVTNTDYVDPLNAGFTVTSSAPAALNASGGTYLFLAIA